MPDRPCRVCGSTKTTLWKKQSLGRELRPEDLRISDSRYGVTLELWKCDGCGFIFAPGKEIDELTSLYEQLTDPGYEESQGPRVLQMRWLLAKARSLQPGARDLLDVGAGTGLLVREAGIMGLDAVGVEVSSSLVKMGVEQYGVDLHRGTYPHPALAGREFDIVFLVDVIEHVADPVALLRDLEAALRPGGLLVVVTPDVSSLTARALGRRWWHLRLAHVGYFNRQSFARAAAAANLTSGPWVTANWFFQIRYLAERLERYLPVGWVNRMAQKVAWLRWCYDRVIKLNLGDSFVVFLRSRRGAPVV